MLRSMASKILWVQIVSVLMTVLALGFSSYLLMVRTVTRAQREKLESIAADRAQMINLYLKHVHDLMDRIDTEDYHRTAREIPLARQFARFSEVLPEMSYLNPQGVEEVKVLHGEISHDFRDYSALPLVKQACQEPNQAIFSPLSRDIDFPDPVYYVADCHQGYFGDEIQGVLLAVLPLPVLVEEFLREPVGNGFFILLDRSGQVLFASETGYPKQSTVTGNSASHLLDSVRKLRAGFSYATLFGVDYFTAYAPVERLNLSVLVVVPREAFMAAPRQLQWATFGLCLLVLLLVTPLTRLLTKNFITRIGILIDHTQKVAAGDLRQRVMISSRDELEKLADSFNAMTESLNRAHSVRDALTSILQSIMDPLVVTDARGNIVQVNQAMERLCGQPAAKLLRQPFFGLFEFDRLSPDERDFAQFLDRGPVHNFETRMKSPDGSVPVLLSCSPISSPVMGLVGILRDISERKQAEEKIERLAYYDPLTGLPNRQLLGDRLDQAIARVRREDGRLAVLFLDLDHFKMVNDTLGHGAGDELLEKVADRLNASMRQSDTLARVGGDEFVILLEIHRAEEVTQIAERIVESLHEPFQVQGHQVFTGTSIGIALYPQDGTSREELLRHADMAMYEAKKIRGSFRFFSRDLNDRVQERLGLEKDLRRALFREEMVVYYQPRLDAQTCRLLGAEALVRWQEPEKGLIPPGKFIALAEETGLILPLGELVLEEACRQGARWQEISPGAKVSVNISGRQLKKEGFVEVVKGVLARSGLPASCLELEVTESILMEYVGENLQTLRELKALGIGLAIDDFGKGYSSLSYLKRFPIDTLKIDREFIHDLTNSADSTSIIRTIIYLARSLNLRAVAEGVETPAQLEFLRKEDCHEIQGFLFGRPMSAENFSILLAEGAARFSSPVEDLPLFVGRE